MIHETIVALTDYGLAVENAVFVGLLVKRQARRTSLRTWWIVFFSALAAASLAGGAVHTLSPEDGAAVRRILWVATLLAMGGAALAAWIVALRMRFAPEKVGVVARFLVVAFAGYCAVVLWVTDAFAVAIVAYLPAALFLLAVFVSAYSRTRQVPVLVGIFGILLTFVAAGAQQLGHNALYHVLQAVALFLLFRAASWSVEAKA